jgi:carboxyl-terminal processing protease
MSEQQPYRRPSLLRWLLLLVFLLIGVYIGQRTGHRKITVSLDTSRELNKLELIMEQIQQNYVDTVNVSELIENTLPLFMEALDPHSIYIPATEMLKANESIEGNFDGIGVTFNMPDDTVVVMNVIAGGPSEKAGIIPGDRIVSVDDSTIAGKNISQNRVVEMLRGKRGTRVSLGVVRSGEERLVHIAVMRDKIPVKSVEAAYMINPTTGFIRLSKFSKTTHTEFLTAVKSLQKQGMTNLVFDLRGNTGGLLEQSFEVANEFLEKGNLIVYTEGRARERSDYFATGSGSCRNIGLALLIDESTASASEIVAGAIQDNDRGTIVGLRSFGKGLVQEPILFSDNSGLRLSVARYYTPTGRSIQKPYTKNHRQEYENELWERYRNGEMNSADSSKLVGQIFRTPKGKELYGQGGIMPDVFVPIDTTGINKYYIAASRRNLLYRYALQFTDEHRAALNDIRSFQALDRFFAQYDMGALFRSYTAKNGLQASREEWEECRIRIETHLRAYVGRNTPLDENAFFYIIANVDTTLNTAVALFN